MTTSFETRLKAEAAALGFVACGIAPADAAPEAAARLRAWLADGAHGSMLWMAERAQQRERPAALWPEVRSIVMLGMSYAPAADPRALAAEPATGRIAAYAQGGDYHDVVKRALKALARWLVAAAPEAGVKVFVDTAPVMEKPLAQAAGIGWQGKHTNLLNRRDGSWLLLGAVMTTLELAPDRPGTGHCGSCNACRAACPTDALARPYRLDARACISYLTIEHRGAIPHRYRSAIGNRVYGCDDCLAACPWNRFARTATAHRAFLPRAELAAPAIGDLLGLDDAGFRQVFAGSPIKRIGRERMVRNALLAAGNGGQSAHLPAVVRLLDDPDAVVRGAAAWALARIDPARFAREALARGVAEPDPEVRAEWVAPAPAPAYAPAP